MKPLHLEEKNLVVERKPFPHFVGFVPAVGDLKPEWEEAVNNEALWKLHEASFYTQRENALPVEEVPALSAFFSEDWLSRLRVLVENSLNCKLSEKIKINLLRLDGGNSINVHNDSPKCGYETHRVLIYLSNYRDEFKGGELVLFSSRDPQSIEAAYRPRAGMIFGFEASNNSFHAVMPVNVGSRLAVQYYFWHEGNDADIATLLQEVLSTSLKDWNTCESARQVYESLLTDEQLDLPHGDTRLIDHLVETSALLYGFGAQEDVYLAGLVHSVSGTKNFKAHGSLTRAVGHHNQYNQIKRLVELFRDIKDSRDLVQLVLNNSQLGEKVLEIWWANVLSSKIHITFSKQRYREEQEVFNNINCTLPKLRNFLEEIYC